VTMPANLKFLSWLLALSMIALPVAGLVNGWFASERWPINYLQIQANFTHLDSGQIQDATATYLKAGFFAVDLNEIRRVVGNLPWVENVEARKQWPDRVVLLVQEYQPVARWNETELISDKITLFKIPLQGNLQNLQSLPKFSGSEKNIKQLWEFYQEANRDMAKLDFGIVEVILSERGSWHLALSNGAKVIIGKENPSIRLQRFLSVLPRVGEGHNRFEYADLRYSNGFSIKWLAEPTRLIHQTGNPMVSPTRIKEPNV